MPGDDAAGSRDRIPDEDLLAALRELADRLDRTPTTRDMRDRGPYSPSTYQSRFGSWTAARERAGVSSDADGVTYTDDELLDALTSFAADLGETPTRAEMREDGPHSPSTYADRFGSWTDALAEAGLDAPENATGIPEADLLADLRRVADELDRRPTSEEVDDHGRYSGVTYYRRFDSWADALDAAGVTDEYPPRSHHHASDGELVAELRRLADVLGRPPTASEMDELGDYSTKTYRRRFDSWAVALRAADLDPERRPTGGEKRRIPTDRLVADVRRVAEECGRPPTVTEMRDRGRYAVTTYLDRFGSWNGALEAADLDRRRSRRNAIPTRDLVAELRRLAVELGRRPRRADMDERGAYAGMTYYNRFGSWADALEAAGVRTEGDRTLVAGYCDTCGEWVREPAESLPGGDGLFCDGACHAVGTKSVVEFETDVVARADDGYLDRLATALADNDSAVASRVLFSLRHASAFLDAEFEVARVDGLEIRRDGDDVTVARESGDGTPAFRFGVDALRRLTERMDAVATDSDATTAGPRDRLAVDN